MISTKLEIKYFGRSAEGKMLTPKLGCERKNDQGNLCALGLKWQTGLGMAKVDGGHFQQRKQGGESVRVSAETQKRGPQAASAGVSNGNLRAGAFLHKKAWSPVCSRAGRYYHQGWSLQWSNSCTCGQYFLLSSCRSILLSSFSSACHAFSTHGSPSGLAGQGQ